MRFLLYRFQLKPRQRLSQNFLVDPRVAGRVAGACGLEPGDRAVEVGPGLGALTLALAETGAEVVAVERDPRLAGALAWVLQEWCRPTGLGQAVFVVVADALQVDLGRLAGGQRPGVVVSNLPYHITSPFLLHLAGGPGWRRAVLTVQQEVAERLAARPGTATYGSLTVAVQARLRVERLFDFSRRCFFPQPEVDAAVVALEPRPPLPADLDRALEAVLRASFGRRRKTLRNSLASLFEWAGQEKGVGPARAGQAAGGPRRQAAQRAEALLAEAGIDPGRRAESVGVEDFLQLAAAWARRRGPG